MNILKDISLETLKRAAEIRQQIMDLEAKLESLLSGKSPGSRAKKKRATKKGAKRKLSPEALEKIREAQRRRWAKVKKKTQAKVGKTKASKKTSGKVG